MDRELRGIVTGRKATDEAVLGAVSRLGPVNEPPSFWVSIANDSTYPDFHRRRAVFALFRRHAHRCTSLRQLSKILQHPTWLSDGGIREISYLTGSIPVEMNPGEKVFEVLVLAGPVIYIRILGDINRDDLSAWLLNPHTERLEDAVILQFGYGDDYEQRIIDRHTQ
jgi:hypothetical protein